MKYRPDFYLASFDTEVFDKNRPRGCRVVAKLAYNERDYWLVRVEPGFGTHDRNDIEYAGDYGQHVPTTYFVVVPRLVGVDFDKIGTQPVHVHVLVPKIGAYPPS